jgi:hypothetical protein
MASKAPEYICSVADPSLATVVQLSSNNSRVKIVPSRRDGTTSLTIQNSVNTSAAILIELTSTLAIETKSVIRCLS